MERARPRVSGEGEARGVTKWVRAVQLPGLPATVLTAYPNPTLREVTVNGDPDELSALHVFNAWGRK